MYGLHRKRNLLNSALLAICAAAIASSAEPTQLEFFSDDSRRWSQQTSAIVLTELSQVDPVSSLTSERREKGKWKVIPYETRHFKGSALSTYSHTRAPTVSLPLPGNGWHAVYVGASTVSTGFREASNGLKVKLSDEKIFKRVANNMALLPNRVDLIQELFVSVAELNGQAIQFGSLPNLPATICYVKLVPLAPEEVDSWKSSKKNKFVRVHPRLLGLLKPERGRKNFSTKPSQGSENLLVLSS